MWSFDDYYQQYLVLCGQRGVRPHQREWMRHSVAVGANPADAFAFFPHEEAADPQLAQLNLHSQSTGTRGVVLTAQGYDKLAVVLARAFDQAANGKGKERHADDKPFHEQPMQLIADKRGIGFILGQADKKSEEAQGMLNRGQKEACVKELLGSIVYLAGAVIFVEKNL